MDDVQGLYIVTAVVLVGLLGWVAAVLARAPSAVDESKRPPPVAVVQAPAPSSDEGPEKLLPMAPETPPKAGTAQEVAIIVPDAPPEAAAALPEVPAPVPLPRVVVLPLIRQRLDSHSEIQDSPANAPLILMPGGDASAKPRDRLALVTAIGRSEPEPGKQPERDAHVEKDRLFVFADGGGRKAGAELVGAIAVESLTQVFAKDEAAKTDDPKLSARANRVRRAVLATNTFLLKRARAMAFAGLGSSAFVAHFSPSNDELFVAHVGANRAYRLRGGELTLLTSAHGKRQVGLVERVEVEVVSLATQPDDLYLFCSDGLAVALGDAGLTPALTAGSSLEETTQRLIAFLNTKEDARDLLAILVRVESTSPVPAPEPEPERLKTVRGLG
jgi:protein phosphatase